VELLKKFKVKPLAVIVGIDRQEKGKGALSARKEVEQDLGIPVRSVLNLDEIVTALHNRSVLGKTWIDDKTHLAIKEYRSQYGA
jgi:orotate phosphoribosyltransferase